MQQVRKNNIDLHVIEPERHNQNPCEGVIREVRRKWFRTIVRSRVPRMFWDYGMRWVCEVMQRTSTQAGGFNGCTPIESVTGETTDISEYLDFGFYDSVWYHENAGLGERLRGCWFGVSHRVGSLMSYYVLRGKCTVISRTTVQRVTDLKLKSSAILSAMTISRKLMVSLLRKSSMTRTSVGNRINGRLRLGLETVILGMNDFEWKDAE